MNMEHEMIRQDLKYVEKLNVSRINNIYTANLNPFGEKGVFIGLYLAGGTRVVLKLEVKEHLRFHIVKAINFYKHDIMNRTEKAEKLIKLLEKLDKIKR